MILTCGSLAAVLGAGPVSAQDGRGLIFGDAGAASLGHADSEQGKGAILGGGAGFHLTDHLLVEGEVHGGRVEHVFGRDQHTFSQAMLTGSVLLRTHPRQSAHFVIGGGLAVQRAHTEFRERPLSPVDRVETIRLLHGRVGADWDLSTRWVLRTHAVVWLGGGLDWVTGGRLGLGYRF
jgi:hypothetical protein